MRHLIALVSVVCGFLHSAAAEELKISTNDLVYAQLFKKIQPGFEKSSGVTLKFITDVSGQGPTVSAPEVLRHVITGQADAGASASGVEDWKKAVEKDAELKAAIDKVTFRVVGKDRLAIVAAKDCAIQSVSKEELAGIFSGRIKKWSELKGAALPIAAGRQKNTVARDRLFRKAVLDDKEFGANVIDLDGYEAMYSFLAKTPGAITFIPETYALEKGLFVLKSPELGRPINMITVGKPSDAVTKLVTYIKSNGG